MFLRGGAGFGAGRFDMGDDFIIGENGRLGFEDLGSIDKLSQASAGAGRQ